MPLFKRLSFSQNLLIALIAINLACGFAVVASVSISETKALTEDRAKRLALVVDGILASVQLSVENLETNQLEVLSSIMAPAIKASPTADAVLLMKLDYQAGLLDWSRFGTERKATEEIPFIVFRAIAERGEAYAEYDGYRIYARKVRNLENDVVGHLFAALSEKASIDLMKPRLEKLIYELIIVFTVQLVIVALLLNRTLSVPLKRVSAKFSRLSAIDANVGEELNKLGELERIERSTEMLAASVKAKANFLANMSHEIRTPMNGILGMLDLLSDSKLTLEQKYQVATVQSSAESLLTILNDILDLSKLEAGKVDFENIPFNVGELLEDVATLFMAPASKRNVLVHSYVDPKLNSKVVSDPVRIRQILTNIIGNAVKFTENGEVIARVFLQNQENFTPELVFSVEDTGIGMSEDVLSGLFQPFYQGDGSTTRRFGGTGLGLTISYQFAELLGGTIKVDSREGEGSNFRVTVPVMISDEPLDISLENIDTSGLHVLVVDDNETNLEIVSAYLDSWNISHDCQYSSTRALEKFIEAQQNKQKKTFNLCLLDYLMPGIDGLALAEKIKQNSQGSSPAIVMLSSAHLDAQKVAEIGISGQIPKPLRKAFLANIIGRVASGKDESNLTEEPTQKAVEQETIKGHILLVEDNKTNQMVAQAMLVKLGLSVDIANDGLEALIAMEEQGHTYDLVLMDCLMPEKDGYEATKEWREHEAKLGGSAHKKIIALTANAQESDKQKCLEFGMDDHLAKPINMKTLRAMLEKWLINNSADL